MALEARISQEIDGNPALELVPGEDEPLPSSDGESAKDERSEGEQTLVVEEGDAKDFERLDDLVREYDWFDEDGEFRGTKSRARVSDEGDIKMEAMANTPARAISLREYLLDQWNLLELPEESRLLGVAIIDNVDDAGRLSTPLEQIAEQFEQPVTLASLKDALARVQQLDPPGIAARSIQECLLLQLEALPGDTELKRQIIEDHFESLQKNRLPQIAKALNVEIDDIKAAITVIGRLSLHPGIDVVDRAVPAIVPDVIVEYDETEDRYTSRLTRGNQRELRISPEFRRALERTRGDKKAREFIKQKLEAAGAIIDAVRYRRERLLEVAKAVVEAPARFPGSGRAALEGAAHERSGGSFRLRSLYDQSHG